MKMMDIEETDRIHSSRAPSYQFDEAEVLDGKDGDQQAQGGG